jgi:hypothetical protein
MPRRSERTGPSDTEIKLPRNLSTALQSGIPPVQVQRAHHYNVFRTVPAGASMRTKRPNRWCVLCGDEANCLTAVSKRSVRHQKVGLFGVCWVGFVKTGTKQDGQVSLPVVAAHGLREGTVGGCARNGNHGEHLDRYVRTWRTWRVALAARTSALDKSRWP